MKTSPSYDLRPYDPNEKANRDLAYYLHHGEFMAIPHADKEFNVIDKPRNVPPQPSSGNIFWARLVSELASLPPGKCICLKLKELPFDHDSLSTPGSYWVAINTRIYRRLRIRNIWQKGMIGHSWNDQHNAVYVWLNQ